MAGAAVRESATFAGWADQMREARAFIGRLLGPSHPGGDVAVTLAIEMVTNSLLHGDSAGRRAARLGGDGWPSRPGSVA
jgi:hypothetical protein